MVYATGLHVKPIDACDHHADKFAGFVDARARIVNRAYAHAWARTHTDRTRAV